MIKRESRRIIRWLWIMLLLTISTQCLWITSYAQVVEDIMPQKNSVKTKCLDIDTDIPYINSPYGIVTNEIINQRVHNFMVEMNNTVDEYKASGYICNYPLEFKASYNIERNNNNVLSFYMDYYQFAGGAHGMSYREPYTMKKNDGIVLGLKDLFNSNYNYAEIINKNIREQINSDKDKYFDGGADFKGVDNKTVFYLTDTELVILYGLYEIAPYASGIIEFKINLNNFKDGLKYDTI
ncbi:DUF3298 and DUF4163 domain-containing protein [uncultured Clostridium sp.]|uniref:DUF3298 and DUF4163 domain-containing protein n=1 Tax=uncultured Clostridium sp. TaxID=59620 RepID=UPI0026356AC8|nr:DUF3298 and DUF4163 domain-containing protein [uncultured Clostridium sp.]